MSSPSKKPSFIYCTQCGTQLTLRANYCHICGNEIKEAAALALKKAIDLYNKGEDAREAERFQEANKYYQESVKSFEEAIRPNFKAAALGRIGICLQRMNLLDDALQYHQEALQVARDAEHLQEVCFELLQIAEVYRKKNEKIPEAIEFAKESLEIAEKLSLKNYKVLSLLALANVTARLNDSKELGNALAYLNRGFTLAQKIRSMPLILKAMVVKGYLETKRKNIGLAETLFTNARKKALELEKEDYVIESTMRLAELEILKYRIDQKGEAESLNKAQDYIALTSQYAKEKNRKFVLLDLTLIESSLHSAQMDFTAARRKSKEALTLAQENKLPLHIANAQKQLETISILEQSVEPGSKEIEVEEVLDYMGEALSMLESLETKEVLSSSA